MMRKIISSLKDNSFCLKHQ